MNAVLETARYTYYGLEWVVYVLAKDEGRPMHVHFHEHSLFVAEGDVWIQRDGVKPQLYSGPAFVFAPADVPHSFWAHSDRAVVVNLTKFEDMTKKDYI